VGFDKEGGMQDVLGFCETSRAWMLDTLDALVRLESPTTDKAAVDRCGVELARRLAAIDGRVERLGRSKAGDHLRAEFGCGASQILLLGHFDTVWPIGQIERMPLRHDGDRLYGPGTFDMKAGIAIGMLAVRAAMETCPPPHRVVMLWTTDEETGSDSSREVIEEEARQSEAVLVLEPALPDGAVKTARKGCGDFELTVRGVPAHAGLDPERGASAIHELARQILAIAGLQDLSRGISVNVGAIRGGTRRNVVAEQAVAEVDVRAWTAAEASALEQAIRTLRPSNSRAVLDIRGGFNRPPMERTEGVARLYSLARQVAQMVGFDLPEGGSGGGSDGNFTAALGIPTLDGLGALGDGAHALHEHVRIDSLVPRAALVAGLMARIPLR
jgi:glutamate carboxypeptidase